MTDNGSCYRSRTFRQALTDAGVTHKRTRPYRPQTNGKVERFNLTLKLEWAYAQPYQQPATAGRPGPVPPPLQPPPTALRSQRRRHP